MTVWGRAVISWALPRSCIATPSSTTLQPWEYLGRGQQVPVRRCAAWSSIEHMFFDVKGYLELSLALGAVQISKEELGNGSLAMNRILGVNSS